MTERITFIHCADLHLDSPFKGMTNLPHTLLEQVKQSTFTALDRLVTLAINKRVDFILMVGDIFDQSVQSVYAEMRFLHACKQLDEAGIAVFLSYGNHDYEQVNQKMIQYPNNVHVFSDALVTTKTFFRNDKALATIHGFSYPERAVWANKTTEYVVETDTPFQLAMLHGSVAQSQEHDHYAPFHLSELTEKNFDYWALGHIHKRTILKEDPPVVYPGNIQGRSQKETGEKGCYYVEMDHEATTLTFHSLQSIRFEKVTLDVSESQTTTHLEEQIVHFIEHNGWGNTLVKIYLNHYTTEIERLYYEQAIDDLIDFINEKYQHKHNWIWIQSIHLIHQKLEDREQLRQEDPFIDKLLQSFQAGDCAALLSPLFEHKLARKHLNRLTESEQNELIKRAEDLVLFELVGKEK